MGKQSIINISDLTSFLECGAILQVSLDQFKMIWGPFQKETLSLDAILNQQDEKTAIYSPDFWNFINSENTTSKISFGQAEKLVSRGQLLDLLQQVSNSKIEVNWDKELESDFTQQFNWSQLQFAQKSLKKTVPIISQSGEISFTSSHLAYALKSILVESHYGSMYGLWQNGEGFFGQTPELILQWDEANQKLQTMALAGTLPLHGSDSEKADSIEKIKKDLKILDEHKIVVDDIFNVLSSISTDIHKAKMDVLALKHLCHLRTAFEVNSVDLNQALQFLKSLHPTAALGMYPRIKTFFEQFQNISNLQKNRHQFAAPFAFIQKNQIKAVAAIRNFYFNPTAITIVSGCGVTVGSILSDELKELENKRNSVKKMMGMNV